jgi:hypothetical protein
LASSVKKPLVIILLIGLYLLVFVSLNVAHFQFVPVTVVLYAALFDAALAAVLTGALFLALHRKWPPVSVTERVLALGIGFLTATIYSIVVPTLIDRSLSVYVLEKLHQYGGGIKQDAFGDVIKRDYFDERRVIDARLTEQLHSGTITIKNGCVHLTPRGELVMRLSQLYGQALLPKRRDLMGTISSGSAVQSQDSAAVISHGCN